MPTKKDGSDDQQPDVPVELPAQVELASPYAFYDDEGQLHSWSAGQIVNEPGQVELLVTRGAPLAE